jgi:hypothetical protein
MISSLFVSGSEVVVSFSPTAGVGFAPLSFFFRFRVHECRDEALNIRLLQIWHLEHITHFLAVRVECLTLANLDALELSKKLRGPHLTFARSVRSPPGCEYVTEKM